MEIYDFCQNFDIECSIIKITGDKDPGCIGFKKVNEISPERLERYLAHADRHVSNRMDRMSQARQRLSKSYEIYHADRPAGSAPGYCQG